MTIYLVNGTGANAARRPISSPAPTIHFGSRLNSVTWIDIEENDHARTQEDHPAAPR